MRGIRMQEVQRMQQEEEEEEKERTKDRDTAIYGAETSVRGYHRTCSGVSPLLVYWIFMVQSLRCRPGRHVVKRRLWGACFEHNLNFTVLQKFFWGRIFGAGVVPLLPGRPGAGADAAAAGGAASGEHICAVPSAPRRGAGFA